MSTSKDLYFMAPSPRTEKAPVMPKWKSGEWEADVEPPPPAISHHMCFPRRFADARVRPNSALRNAFAVVPAKIFSSKVPSSRKATAVTVAPTQCVSHRVLADSTSGNSGILDVLPLRVLEVGTGRAPDKVHARRE